ncbi:MAG: T9SS type A sorting domain-containing protein [Bacteroidetes bacterium]|nr:T9SS type A sorting domain-containing protein [Bacteroidota bacterium]
MKTNMFNHYAATILFIVCSLSASAQVKAPKQVTHKFKAELRANSRHFGFNMAKATFKSHAAKKSSYLLDSVETYTFNGNDSDLTAFREFGYNAQDRITNDASYYVKNNGNREGDERTTYEYGPGYYAEITHSWDIVAEQWDNNQKTEYRASLSRTDTVIAVLEFNWNPGTNQWDGFEGGAFLDKNENGGEYNLRIALEYNLTTRKWDAISIDSTFTDANGNITHQKRTEWNETTMKFELDYELKSTYSQRGNNRIRVREIWDEGTNGFVVMDSFLFKYAADTVLESGVLYGPDTSGVFDTLSYLTSIINTTKDTVVQTFFGRDSSGFNFDPFRIRIYALNAQNEVIGFEEFDLDLGEGISKRDVIKNGNNETIIDFEWDYVNKDWILSEKQEYEYNSKGYLTLNSFYYYETGKNAWVGAEKRTYVFASNNETVLNRTNYKWSGNNWDLDTKIDYSYDSDNDPTLIVYSTHDGSNWVVDEKDYFYYGTPTISVSNPIEVLSVYPNPAIETIQFKSIVNNIQIIGLNGRVLLQNQQENSLEISSLVPGVYQIIGEQNGKMVTARFIKQ